MALWSAARENFTPVAVADTANYTDNGYFALKGGTSTQQLEVIEVYIGGLATTAAAAQHKFGRDSTVGATSLSGGTLAALNPATADLGTNPSVFSVSTTKPQRSATLGALLPLGFNVQGGVVRWKVPRGAGEGVGLLGNTASFGELSLSHATTGVPGLIDTFFIFEPS
jgi:hypothetical protein